MFDLQDYLLVGVFTRTHGVQGAIILRLQGLEAEDLPEMEWVFVEIDGLPVPFLVNEVRMLHADKVIISLDAVSSESRARELAGCKLFIPHKKHPGKKKAGSGLPDMQGFTVMDKKYGELGKVAEILEITGNPLLKIKSGEKELLIPMHRDIILKIFEKERSVLIKAPEGLMDL